MNTQKVKEQDLKTRKGNTMKKSTMEALYTVINKGAAVTDELRAEFNAEYERTTAKSRANAAMYDEARDFLMNTPDWDRPMTAAELAETFAADLPDGFSKSKVQYALLHYWVDSVERHDNGKNAYTYTRK